MPLLGTAPPPRMSGTGVRIGLTGRTDPPGANPDREKVIVCCQVDEGQRRLQLPDGGVEKLRLDEAAGKVLQHHHRSSSATVSSGNQPSG